jgi:hypothetical protein
MTEFVKEIILSGGRTILMMGVLSALFITLGFLFAPETLKGLGKTLNRIFDIDDWMMMHRISAGIVFLICTIIMALTLYNLK